MRLFMCTLSIGLGSLLAGCTAGDPAQPQSIPHPTGGGLGIAATSGPTTEVALQRVRFTIDPLQGTAAVTALESRRVQQTDDTYLLSIDNFTNSDTLRVTGVRNDAGAVLVDYLVTHPFAASSDLDAPPTASNRADLAISARVVMLLDVPTAVGATYFAGDGPAIANTTLLDNPDGYFQPRGLLTNLGAFTANTFPYQLVVDEADDNRVAHSNSGLATGNYGAEGWQRDSIGADRASWTGFDVLHQGQAGTNTLAINRAALEAGDVLTFDAVLLAKYNDPRGGTTGPTKRSNRLPASPADVERFTYRYPHGAIDVSAVTYLGESGGLIANTISSSTLAMRIRDWDSRAPETILPDLADDFTVGNVAAGESGLPTVSVSIPELLGTSTVITFDNGTDLLDDDTAFGGDATPDTGAAMDELFYSRLLTNTMASGQSEGPITGLIRVRDVEADLDTSAWERPLSPTLAPLSADLPEPISYQRMILELAPDNAPPSMTLTMLTPSVGSGGACTIRAAAISDPDSDDITLEVDWDDDGTYTPVTTFSIPYPAQSDHTSPITYTFTAPAPDLRDVPARYSDGADTIPVLLAFEVVNACPSPAPPKAGSDRTGLWGSLNASNYTGLGWGPSGAPADYASFRSPTYPGVVLQRRDSGNSNLYRITEDFPITPANATPLTSGNLGGILNNRAVLDIEIDSTNRVFVSVGITSWSNWPAIIKYFTGANQGAGPNIYWFDYGGSAVGVPGGTISTAGMDVMALCLGQNDDLYVIDRSHVLHHYPRLGGYVENVTAPFPMALGPIIGTATGPDNSSTNFKVCDLVQNWHNGAFYVLTVSGVGSANGRIHRIPCDGVGPTVSAPFTVIDITSGSRNADIVIDQIDAAGNPIPEGDVQFVVGGQTLFTAGPDLRLFNSDLQETASQDFGMNDTTASKGRLTVSSTNKLFISEDYSTSFGYYTSTPAGWL